MPNYELGLADSELGHDKLDDYLRELDQRQKNCTAHGAEGVPQHHRRDEEKLLYHKRAGVKLEWGHVSHANFYIRAQAIVCKIILFSCFSVHGVNVQKVMCDNISTTVKKNLHDGTQCVCALVAVCEYVIYRLITRPDYQILQWVLQWPDQ